MLRLNKEINAGLADPKMKARFSELGGVLHQCPPADFGKMIAGETEKWGMVVEVCRGSEATFHNVPFRGCAR